MEVSLIELVSVLSDLSGWILLFIFGIWVGVILIHYRLVQINRGIKDLNRHFQGLSPSPGRMSIADRLRKRWEDQNPKNI